MNYAKAHGWLQGSLECLVNSLEIKIRCDHKGEVVIPEEVIDELKEQISKMLKRSEEVGNEPSEFTNVPKKEEEEDNACNLPVPEEDAGERYNSYPNRKSL